MPAYPDGPPMLPRPAILLVLLLGLPALAAAQGILHVEAEARPMPRGSILVDGDAGFLSPLSGVRGGSGTPADPYRISGYVLSHDGPAALRLHGTRAHVVIEDVLVPRGIGHAGAALDCAARLQSPLCQASLGIDLVDAENVTLRNVRVDYDVYPLRLLRAKHVVLDTVHLGDAADVPLRPVVGLRIESSEDVSARRLTVEAASFPVQVFESADVRIASSLLDGTLSDGNAFHVRGSRGVALEDSRLLDVAVRFEDANQDVRVFRNELLGPLSGVGDGLGTADDLVVCGNAIRGTKGLGGIYLIGGERMSIRHNRIEDNALGVLVGFSPGLVFEANLVANSTEEGLWLLASPAAVHNNSFLSNGLGVYVPVNGTDLTRNWWGDASGPSDVGPGSGEALRSEAGIDVPHAPWLTQPPAAAPDCGPAGQAHADVAPLRRAAHARVEVVLPPGPVTGGVVLDAGVTLLP